MSRFAAMEVFIRVVETGSFSGAARLLNVQQPAVSKSVAQLEKRLGVQLLLRTTHRLTPTEAGQGFYERAKRAVEEAEEAEMVARGAGATLAGRLRICVSVTFGSVYVIPRIPAFLARHPALELEIKMDDRNIDLVEGGIDVAFRIGPLAASSHTARKIGQCRRVVVGAPGYFDRVGEPLTPGDLAAHEALMIGLPGHGAAWSFRRDATETSVTLHGRTRIDAGEGVRAAVLSEIGLAVSSEWMFYQELKDGRVKPVLSDWVLPPLDLWAVFPAGRRTNAKTRALVSFIESKLESEGFAPR